MAQDGGFIATGQVWDDDPLNGLQKIWVLKVDSIGCDSAGCDTTVGIKEQPGGMEAWGHGGLYLWPNPAREQIHGRLNLDSLSASWRNGRSNRDLSLIIYDIFGREVYTEMISSTLEGGMNWQINVESFPQGIYLAVAKDCQIMKASAKFVVER